MPRFLLAILGCAVFTGILMAKTPTPPSTLLLQEGKFEIRRYETLSLVRVPMDRREGNGESFGKLFAFISGKNKEQKKIPMTAPVLMEGRDQKSGMSFIMPEEMRSGDVPVPQDIDLERVNLPGGRFAVYRFSGSGTSENEAEARRTLEDWMKAHKLQAAAEPIFGYYDPPWIPVWFRHNEIWIRLVGE